MQPTQPWTLPRPVDAATTWHGAIYLFSGGEYKRYSMQGEFEAAGVISRRWDGLNLSKIDAAFRFGSSDYFFSGRSCLQWSAGRVTAVSWGPALPLPLDAAVEIGGAALLFKGSRYYQVDVANRSVVAQGAISSKFPQIANVRVQAAFPRANSTVFVMARQWVEIRGDKVLQKGELASVPGLLSGSCEGYRNPRACTSPCHWCGDVCSRRCGRGVWFNLTE